MEAGCDELGTSSFKQFTVVACCTAPEVSLTFFVGLIKNPQDSRSQGLLDSLLDFHGHTSFTFSHIQFPLR